MSNFNFWSETIGLQLTHWPRSESSTIALCPVDQTAGQYKQREGRGLISEYYPLTGHLFGFINNQPVTKWKQTNIHCPANKFTQQLLQGCHIWVGPKFPDISLTIPWHITIFPWQFTLFFQVKNKDDLQKQWKILVSTSAVLAINQLM